jgi:hypothetical protein
MDMMRFGHELFTVPVASDDMCTILKERRRYIPPPGHKGLYTIDAIVYMGLPIGHLHKGLW